MTNTRIIIVCVLAVCLLAVYLLQSGTEERLAMLIRDGRQQEASTEIKSIIASGWASPRMLATLARLQESAGEPASAAETMELFLTVSPADRDTLVWLVKAYEQSQNVPSLIDALARLAAVEPDQDVVVRLTALYRYYGRFQEERAALENFAQRATLDDAQTVRLAQLLATERKFAAAADIMRKAEQNRPSSEQTRKLFFGLLIEAKQYSEAAQRAQTWLVQWNKPWLATQLTLRLAQDAPADIALKLAVVAARLYPDARFFLAKSLANQGSHQVANLLLANWPADGGSYSESEIQGYVAAAAAIGGPTAVWQKFAEIRSRQSDPEAQAMFAEAIANHFGYVSLASQPALPLEVLKRRPLFGVRLALELRRLGLAQWLLSSANPSLLSPADQSAWFNLLVSMHGMAGTLHILAALEQRKELPSGLLPAYRTLRVQFGFSEVSARGSNDLFKQISFER